MPAPVTLSWSGPIRYTDENNLGAVIVSWQETINAHYHNQLYHIIVKPAIQGCDGTCATSSQSKELILAVGTQYNVTVIKETCSGKLRSVRSKALSILLNGTFQ